MCFLLCIPPKFNSSPLKNGGLKITFLLGWLIFRGYVKLEDKLWTSGGNGIWTKKKLLDVESIHTSCWFEFILCLPLPGKRIQCDRYISNDLCFSCVVLFLPILDDMDTCFFSSTTSPWDFFLGKCLGIFRPLHLVAHLEIWLTFKSRKT